MKGSLYKAWRWVRWPLAILAVAYIGLVIYRVQYLNEQDKTNAAVAAIHAQKLTRDDVFGPLVAAPDKAANDATVAGIDSNNNGIRDDVERQIYLNHKDSAKVTAAMLQYAKALQSMLTRVYNTETWVAAAEEGSRGDLCVGITSGSDTDLYLSRSREVKDLMLNTPARKDAWNKAYSYATTFGLPNTNICNVDISTLPN